jgi:hypothetical protein
MDMPKEEFLPFCDAPVWPCVAGLFVCGALALLLLLLLLLQCFTTHRVGVEQNHPVALLPASHRHKQMVGEG